MKRFLLILLTLCLSIHSVRLFASPQQSEFLIIKNDTIPIYQILLTDVIEKHLDSVSFLYGKGFDAGVLLGTNNWRGYRGIWELKDDTLYLVGFKFGFGGLSLEKLFPDMIKDGKVLADWYNSELIIPKGKVLRWDGIFSRTYVEEEHLNFKNGHVKSRQTVCNYIDLPNGISRLSDNPYNPKGEIANVLFNRIVSIETDWNKVDENSNDDVLIGEFYVTIGANGRVVSVTNDIGEKSDITRFLKRRLKGLRFDIIKFNGKPYEEVITLFIDLNEDKNQLELLNIYN
ncbi:MAG: hypothetical protein IK103_01100 [Bacteroidales bacterium]|nr:hypothetical protein [Bacteroidales bacterium]